MRDKTVATLEYLYLGKSFNLISTEALRGVARVDIELKFDYRDVNGKKVQAPSSVTAQAWATRKSDPVKLTPMRSIPTTGAEIVAFKDYDMTELTNRILDVRIWRGGISEDMGQSYVTMTVSDSDTGRKISRIKERFSDDNGTSEILKKVGQTLDIREGFITVHMNRNSSLEN